MSTIKRITSQDVAKLAGVTKASVSRVMNNIPTVSKEIRERVLYAARTLDYRPSSAARGLARSRLETLGLICGIGRAIGAYYSAQLINGVSQALTQQEHRLTIAAVECEDTLSEIRQLPIVTEHSVDGLIIDVLAQSAEQYETIIRDLTAPHVMVNPPTKREYDSIIPDDITAAADATNYLISRGHRRIAYVPGEANHYSQVLRRQGYLEAMARAGLPPLPWWDEHVPGTDNPDGSRILDERIGAWTGQHGCTAMLTYDATDAMRSLWMCGKRQLRIPEDISIMSCDYMPALEYAGLPISCMMLDRRTMGETAVSMLLAKLKSPDRQIPSELIKPSMMERESVRSITDNV